MKIGVGIDTEAQPSWSDRPAECRRGTFPEDLHNARLSELPAPHRILVIAVPLPKVDRTVDIENWLRRLEGMDIEHHHGMDPKANSAEFPLNHLLVFRRTQPRDRLQPERLT